MLEIAGGAARLRPHVKTHKLGPLIRRQIELGITKFKAATIAEAELCGQVGALDVVLSFPPAGPHSTRLVELARRYPRTRFAAVADHAAAIRGLSVAARAGRVELDVLLDLDAGMGRTGIVPGNEALELYRLIAQSPALRAAGLHAYDGHIHEADAETRRTQCEAAFEPVLRFREMLEHAGLSVPVLIAGGTPTFPFHAKQTDRECSPGTTVLWDFGYADKFTERRAPRSFPLGKCCTLSQNTSAPPSLCIRKRC
jgi:D-serine deaminase-like pyridoxal phosphate-dependent protein